MDNVKNWLENPVDYWQGVSLYAQQRGNKNILRMLELKESASNRKKLAYELGKFSSQPSSAPKVAKLQVSELVEAVMNEDTIDVYVSSEIKKQKVTYNDLPEEMWPVLDEANSAFREACRLKIRLNRMPDDAEDECLQIQLQIEAKLSHNRLCWDKVDYFMEHRAVPAEKPSEFEDMSPARLVKRQQLLFSSISKLKKRIEANRLSLSIETSVKEKTRLEKAVAKACANLLSQEADLLKINNLIDGNG